MKNKIITTVFIVILIFIFSVPSFAQIEEEYKDIYNEINSNTRDLLQQTGIEDVDFDSLMSLSPKKIIDLLVSLISGNAGEPLKAAAIAVSLIIIASIYKSINTNKLRDENILSFAQSVIVITSLVIPLSQAMVTAVSSIKLISDFMLLYIPAFTGIVSASGQPLSAFTYSGIMLGFSEICSKASQLLFIPLIAVITALNVFSAAGGSIEMSVITKTVKKVITVSLTVIAGVFTGLLSLKGTLAVATDNVAVKGIKLLSGSVIPFIGGAVGEAYNSVLGAFSVVKSTVGVFGIIVILLIVLPSLINMLVWYFSLSICSIISSLCNDSTTNKILDSFLTCISLVNIILVFCSVVFIVSTGILLSFRG